MPLITFRFYAPVFQPQSTSVQVNKWSTWLCLQCLSLGYDENCCSAHKDHARDHLPVILVRATHNGNANCSTPPNYGTDSDGSIWPRYRGCREIGSWEVDCHGKTQILSPNAVLLIYDLDGSVIPNTYMEEERCTRHSSSSYPYAFASSAFGSIHSHCPWEAQAAVLLQWRISHPWPYTFWRYRFFIFWGSWRCPFTNPRIRISICFSTYRFEIMPCYPALWPSHLSTSTGMWERHFSPGYIGCIYKRAFFHGCWPTENRLAISQ